MHPAFGGAHQSRHHGAVFTDSVEHLLDRQRIRIIGGLLHQPQHRIVAFVGVVQQETATLEDIEH